MAGSKRRRKLARGRQSRKVASRVVKRLNQKVRKAKRRAKSRAPKAASLSRKSIYSNGLAEEGKTFPFLKTHFGQVVQGDSLDVLRNFRDGSVDLFMTSPPFGLVRKKDYGNVEADEYVEWFKPFATEMYRCLKDSGSLVIDIGGAWNKGYPTRNLYHFKLLIALCEEIGFHLAQDFYWWNPARLPTPAEWVTVRRIRVKDAINTVWWLSKTPWPKASNRRVLQPYSPAMQTLLENGYTAKKRPSGHDISEKFSINNGAAIPPNLIAVPNTESNSYYLRYCEERGLSPHPARYPAELPEFFVRMLTDIRDTVVDPFAGSCITGEVCERLQRDWTCIEILMEYCEAARGRFIRPASATAKSVGKPDAPSDERNYYQVPRPGVLWNGPTGDDLPADGGRKRPEKPRSVSEIAPTPRSDLFAKS
ncbi:MAG: site-specific DNA-methyltransferase [Bradyrhizobiaceae bacterium]|nr:site-specific DNA-methyltransferase [Bradyrhizobiaceae bacterium]